MQFRQAADGGKGNSATVEMNPRALGE
jgi:hypothetical protein